MSREQHVPELPSGRDASRLPVWAQEHLDMLRRRLQESYDKIDALNGAEVTDTQARDYSHGPQQLGNGRQVRFYLDVERAAAEEYRGCIDVRVKSDGRDRFVEVNTVGGGAIVEPWSSNVVRIRVRER